MLKAVFFLSFVQTLPEVILMMKTSAQRNPPQSPASQVRKPREQDRLWASALKVLFYDGFCSVSVLYDGSLKPVLSIEFHLILLENVGKSWHTLWGLILSY